VVRLYVRFTTAWAALVFAGQLGGQPVGTLNCLRGGPGNGWWIRADLTLEVARELVTVGSGEIYRPDGEQLVRDRAWGAARQQTIAVSALQSITMLEMIRAAGLQAGPPRPLREAVLLLPGYLVAGVVRRAMDLQLEASYRPVAMSPLFEPDTAARTGYELYLRAGSGATLPAFFMAALDRDPFILVCRLVGDTVLMRHHLTSPLPDNSLASLSADEIWVFADAAYGCARLRPLGEARDGISLVRRGADHELVDVSPEPGWVTSAEAPAEPVPPELTLVRANMTGMPVDAALLDDADLGCLPALLAGEPLAEAAMVIRGLDRHLLTAPGGLLEQLPVGEPLYCLGPGSLYLPLGYRLKPALPPAAREELFPTDKSTAIVLLSHAALRYRLERRKPVWRLWAGPVPQVDDQLPAETVADLQSLDPELPGAGPDPAGAGAAGAGEPGEPAGLPGSATPTAPQPAQPSAGAPDAGSPARTWRDEAYEAELSRDFVTAAEIHLQHDDPLRAARLYERAAESD
jgi:hypothetical protein